MPLAWAIAAASPAALAYIPLIAGIVRGSIRAERLSWAIWAAEYGLLFFVQVARGGGPLLWLIGAGTAGCLLTFALTLWRGHGGLSPARLVVLAGALAALAAWRHARSPSAAFGLLVAVEGAATVPTVLNAYRAGTESVLYWLLIGLAAVLEIPALALGGPPAPPLSYAFAAAVQAKIAGQPVRRAGDDSGWLPAAGSGLAGEAAWLVKVSRAFAKLARREGQGPVRRTRYQTKVPGRAPSTRHTRLLGPTPS